MFYIFETFVWNRGEEKPICSVIVCQKQPLINHPYSLHTASLQRQKGPRTQNGVPFLIIKQGILKSLLRTYTRANLQKNPTLESNQQPWPLENIFKLHSITKNTYKDPCSHQFFKWHVFNCSFSRGQEILANIEATFAHKFLLLFGKIFSYDTSNMMPAGSSVYKCF